MLYHWSDPFRPKNCENFTIFLLNIYLYLAQCTLPLNNISSLGVQSHLVATLELTPTVGKQVLEHDFPAPTKQSAS
jgi:hypothetical protein